jgi:hypothetical protein
MHIRQQAAAIALLVAATAVAAFLRLDSLGDASFWLDEILGQQITTNAASLPWWRWLTGIEHEHGPLYYLTQIGARLFGSSEAAGRAPAVLLGLATVPLLWLAARRAGEGISGAVAASALLTVSPLHVYYSREARPYALAMFLAAAFVVILLRRTAYGVVGLVLLAALYTSALVAPLVIAAAIASFIAAAITPDPALRQYHRAVALLGSGTAALFPLLYRSSPTVVSAAPFPGLDAAFFWQLLRSFTVSALASPANGRTAVAILVFGLVGAVVIWRRDRRAGVIVAAMTILPPAIAILSLWLLGHWYAVRYVSPALIAFLLLAGSGVAAVGGWVSKPLRRGREVAVVVCAVAMAIAIGWQVWPAARTEPFQKLDWRGITRTIWSYAREGDLVIVAEPWSEVSVGYYLHNLNLPPRVILNRVPSSKILEKHRRQRPSWLVTAGFSSHTEVRDWMCRYPLLMASPLDNFRLHYASAANDFLRERATPAELRAQAAGVGSEQVMLHMGPDEVGFLGEGWADAERAEHNAFRWALGGRAAINIPRWGSRDRVIRFVTMPMDHRSLPPQNVRVSLNGAPAGVVELRPGWSTGEVSAPAQLWKNGLNEIVFEFARFAAPARLDRAANDDRLLAAAFDWISITDRGVRPAAATPAAGGLLRIASAPLLHEKNLWRNTETRLPPERLRREAVAAILGRMGYDAEILWPRLVRGDVHLDNIAETLAWGEACEDEVTFLRRIFAVLLGRAPTPDQEREMVQQLRSGTSRVRMVGRIVKSGDFRSMVLRGSG